jgi:hypothetical protein
VSVALVIQHAQRMRRIILSSVACPAVPYFPTLSHKRHDFRKKVIERKMCVLIFSTTFVWNISLQRLSETFLFITRIQRDINVHRSSCKVPLFLSDFNDTWIFSTHFQNILKCQMGRDSSVGIATRYGLDGPGIESRWGRDFPHPSRPALVPTQPPTQWVPGLDRGVELTTHPHLAPRLKKE